MIMQTYVYEGVEVRKTGRVAERDVKVMPGKSNKLQLVEIEPVNGEFDWKKWVNPEHLFQIKKG